MTCYDDVLKAANQIIKEKGKNEFAPKEIKDFLLKNGTIYKNYTIEHELQRCCVDCNSERWWDKTYDFYEKGGRGKYKIRKKYLDK